MTDAKRCATHRLNIIKLANKARVAHLGSSLSCVDIIDTLYEHILGINADNVQDPSRNRFILSKGHAAMTLYTILHAKGLLSDEELETFGQDGTILAEHPDPKVRGVEAATGSLGHGFQIGLGMALASKINNTPFNVYALLSDGECNEGSVWEGAMFAPAHGLDNMTAIVDFNKWQATGRSREVLSLDPLADKWKSFGWEVVEVDGHDHQQLKKELSISSNKPRVLIAHTVKGKGVSFMEDDNNWHYRVPNEEEIDKAKAELGL